MENRSRSRRPGEKVLTRYPLDSTYYSESLKSGVISVDEEGNVRAVPVFFINPNRNPMTNSGNVSIYDPATGDTYGANVAAINVNNLNVTAFNALVCSAIQNIYNPANNAGEVVRTPTIFRTAQVSTAAATVVWDPAANARFRLMGGIITFGGVAQAAAAQTTITLLDGAAAIALQFNAYIPAAAADVARPPIAFDLRPNGYRSTTVDNILNATLTANLSAGNICITVWGTEEP